MFFSYTCKVSCLKMVLSLYAKKRLIHTLTYQQQLFTIQQTAKNIWIKLIINNTAQDCTVIVCVISKQSPVWWWMWGRNLYYFAWILQPGAGKSGYKPSSREHNLVQKGLIVCKLFKMEIKRLHGLKKKGFIYSFTQCVHVFMKRLCV